MSCGSAAVTAWPALAGPAGVAAGAAGAAASRVAASRQGMCDGILIGMAFEVQTINKLIIYQEVDSAGNRTCRRVVL
jgi:hypothetical protein